MRTRKGHSPRQQQQPVRFHKASGHDVLLRSRKARDQTPHPHCGPSAALLRFSILAIAGRPKVIRVVSDTPFDITDHRGAALTTRGFIAVA